MTLLIIILLVAKGGEKKLPTNSQPFMNEWELIDNPFSTFESSGLHSRLKNIGNQFSGFCSCDAKLPLIEPTEVAPLVCLTSLKPSYVRLPYVKVVLSEFCTSEAINI